MKYAKLLYIEKARKRKAEELRLQKSLFISKNTARSWLRTIQAKILSQQKLITNLKVANIYSSVRKKKMQHEMTFMSLMTSTMKKIRKATISLTLPQIRSTGKRIIIFKSWQCRRTWITTSIAQTPLHTGLGVQLAKHSAQAHSRTDSNFLKMSRRNTERLGIIDQQALK